MEDAIINTSVKQMMAQNKKIQELVAENKKLRKKIEEYKEEVQWYSTQLSKATGNEIEDEEVE